jgi:LacI family transcriptional regulator
MRLDAFYTLNRDVLAAATRRKPPSFHRGSIKGARDMNKTNNIKINEIAETLGLSASTVSIVLNGRGNDLRISEQTQKRVLNYCAEMNYQPNIYARRLRAAAREETAPIIALFFPVLTNGIMISRFLAGIQDVPEIATRKVELVLQPYESDRLSMWSHMLSRNRYSGAIIIGMSTRDEAFIFNTDFNIPIVLLNRFCSRHNVVCVDNEKVGFTAATLFQKTGHSRVALAQPMEQTEPLSRRSKAFIEQCKALKLSLPKKNVLLEEMSYAGGAKAAECMIRQNVGNLPTAVLFLDSSMAVGSLLTFRKAGLRVPEDIQVLSYGDNNLERFTAPALSCIRMPTEDMSCDCVRILLRAFKSHQRGQEIITHDAPVILRESFLCPPEVLAEVEGKGSGVQPKISEEKN